MITSSELLAYMAIFFCNNRMLPCSHKLLKDFGLSKAAQDLIDKEIVNRVVVKGTYHYFICKSITVPTYGKEDFELVKEEVKKFLNSM